MTSPGLGPGIRLSIESLLEDVFLVGLAVRAYAAHVGFDDSDAFLVELAVIEAINNAITHAYGGQPGHRVDVSVTIPPGWMIVAVSWVGIIIPSVSGKESDDDPSSENNLSDGGRGLLIIRHVMDEVRFETEGDRQVMTMKKRLAGTY